MYKNGGRVNNKHETAIAASRGDKETGWESVAAKANEFKGEKEAQFEIKNLSPDDNFDQVAEALYLVDQYIFPDLFGDEDGAKKFAKALFTDDPNALFSYDKTLVAKDQDGNIAGLLIYRGDKCTPWDTDQMREKFLEISQDLPENFERANEKYMKKVTDPELPKDAAEIEFLGVREAYRGQGIGGKLMQSVYDDPRFSEVHLDVLDSHPAARSLYDKKGFIPDGDKFPNYPDGNEWVQHMVRKNPNYLHGDEK